MRKAFNTYDALVIIKDGDFYRYYYIDHNVLYCANTRKITLNGDYASFPVTDIDEANMVIKALDVSR